MHRSMKTFTCIISLIMCICFSSDGKAFELFNKVVEQTAGKMMGGTDPIPLQDKYSNEILSQKDRNINLLGQLGMPFAGFGDKIKDTASNVMSTAKGYISKGGGMLNAFAGNSSNVAIENDSGKKNMETNMRPQRPVPARANYTLNQPDLNTPSINSKLEKTKFEYESHINKEIEKLIGKSPNPCDAASVKNSDEWKAQEKALREKIATDIMTQNQKAENDMDAAMKKMEEEQKAREIAGAEKIALANMNKKLWESNQVPVGALLDNMIIVLTNAGRLTERAQLAQVELDRRYQQELAQMQAQKAQREREESSSGSWLDTALGVMNVASQGLNLYNQVTGLKSVGSVPSVRNSSTSKSKSSSNETNSTTGSEKVPVNQFKSPSKKGGFCEPDWKSKNVMTREDLIRSSKRKY